MNIQLMPDKSLCKVDGLHLKTGQVLDYKGATENKLSMGRIVAFKYAGNFDQENTESVWMLVSDTLTKGGPPEWISVRTWKEQYDDGIFSTKKQVVNVDTEPEDSENLPF